MEDTLQPRIRAIIGLGNPGRDYRGTRHNLGFDVVDFLAAESGFTAGMGSYYSCEKEFSSVNIVLLKPTTFMNRSGLAVAAFAELYGYKPDEMLVICDDFNLPLGQIRLRKEGSDGGHNGLASVIYQLGSDTFPRIRMGIGPVPDGIAAEDFVLEPFTTDELPRAEEMIKATAQAAMTWIDNGYEVAAARFNRAV
jgi:PTH1 family peptidyl-tRNA hydrolase